MYEHIDLVKIWRLKMGKNELEIYFYLKDTFNKLGYKAKINTHTTSYIN